MKPTTSLCGPVPEDRVARSCGTQVPRSACPSSRAPSRAGFRRRRIAAAHRWGRRRRFSGQRGQVRRRRLERGRHRAVALSPCAVTAGAVELENLPATERRVQSGGVAGRCAAAARGEGARVAVTNSASDAATVAFMTTPLLCGAPATSRGSGTHRGSDGMASAPPSSRHDQAERSDHHGGGWHNEREHEQKTEDLLNHL